MSNHGFRLKKECKECGKHFLVMACKRKRAFCSQACSNKKGAWLGKPRSKETIEKISKAKLGSIPWNLGLKTGPSVQRDQPRKNLQGEKHPQWKGGISITYREHRGTIEYRKWRFAIYEKFNNTCQECGKKCEDRDRIAHHIRPVDEYPSLLLDRSNGLLLCRACHSLVHNLSLSGVLARTR